MMFEDPRAIRKDLAKFKIRIPEVDDLAALIDAVWAEANIEAENVVAKFDAGKLTAKTVAGEFSASVRHAVEKSARHQLAGEITKRAGRKANRSVRKNAPLVCDNLQKPFADIVKRATPAIEMVGAKPSSDVAKIGGTAADAYHTLRDLNKDLNALTGMRMALSRPPAEASWFCAPTDLNDLSRAEKAYANGGVFGLVEAGYEVRVNTPAEVESILENAETATARNQARKLEDDPGRKKRQRDAEREMAAWERLVPKA